MNEIATKTGIRGKKELWERIKNYKFNHLVPKSAFEEIIGKLGGKNAPVRAFAHKIMKKHRLPRAFTFRAIEEYRKFVYLGVISDFVVTPSKYIDIIWHEHLLFSKAYREFCNEVIHYQFDHQPELMTSEDQTELYTEQYLETLDLYRKEFFMEPPENIWGVPKFDKNRIDTIRPKSKKKNYDNSSVESGYLSDGPLHINYAADSLSNEFSGFDGGDFGGGGAGGGWGDSSDSGGGGDGGSSCSSCSSGCGGGGD
jgi:hypothetical protein